MVTFLASAFAFAAPADLAAQWAAVEPSIRAHTGVPVPLSDDQLEALSRGEIVTTRFDTEAGAYATGAAWIEAPIDLAWLCITDGEHDPAKRTTLRVLPAPEGVRRVHLTLHLPFPIADRQWVSEIVPNRALHTATGGRVWQRQWDLADRALAQERDSAVWLKQNRGAWTLLDTGDGTLMVFSVRTVLGGLLPTSITQGWALRSLRGKFRETGPRALGMRQHYDSAHRPIPTPSGADVVRFPRASGG